MTARRIRFSSCPITDVDGSVTEFGVDPDIHVDMSDADRAQGRDTILETAFRVLGRQSAP